MLLKQLTKDTFTEMCKVGFSFLTPQASSVNLKKTTKNASIQEINKGTQRKQTRLPYKQYSKSAHSKSICAVIVTCQALRWSHFHKLSH